MSRETHAGFCERRGVRLPPATHLVVLCRTQRQAEAALHASREVLAGLGLELHPAKTKVVDLREGRNGFDFLGWHFRARVSGRLLERGIRRYYLHRWPSQRSMKRLRAKIKARTGRNRAGIDLRELIEELNPILRGWGNYFRTGNSSIKFVQIDRYVDGRLRGLLLRRYGRNLARALAALDARVAYGSRLTPADGHHPLPAGWRRHARKTIGKPCAGKPHARIERGIVEPGPHRAPRQ